jgi:hypothetical protein
MSSPRKVIITCAVTGAIHTPSMSPHLPVTPDQIIADALGAAESGRGDPASACARSFRRQAGPDARSVRALPAAHQTADGRGHQSDDGRQSVHVA